MKKSIIYIKKQSFIYKNKEYLLNQYKELNKIIKKNKEFIILEEELYSRYFKKSLKKSHIYEYVEFKLKKEFYNNNDILYHYEYDTKTCEIVIHSIKGGKKIQLISNECDEIKVIPIQFIIKNTFMEILKEEKFNFNCVVYFLENYYYIDILDGKFYRTFVEKNIDSLVNRIGDFGKFNGKNEKKFYVDSNLSHKDMVVLKNIKKEITVIHINCEDLLNEKIYKKQKLCSNRIL